MHPFVLSFGFALLWVAWRGVVNIISLFIPPFIRVHLRSFFCCIVLCCPVFGLGLVVMLIHTCTRTHAHTACGLVLPAFVLRFAFCGLFYVVFLRGGGVGCALVFPVSYPGA